jgi:hypothetical protein
MSDSNQTNAPESTGGEQFSWRNLPGGDEFAAGMAEFATRDSGGDDSDTDIGERMSADDYQTGSDASESAVQPAGQSQSKPMDMQALMIQMQQQQLQMFNEMQQQIAMQQSQSVAAAVQAALASMGIGQQQQVQEEIDPIAALDPDDPDYFFKKTDAELMMLKRQNQELVNRLETERMQQMQAVQQQQQLQQQQTFVSQVNNDLGRAVDYVFQGWPDSPQVQALKQLAANTVDAEWHATGYKPEGYAIGIRKAQQMLKSMEGMKHNFAAPKAGNPPVGRGMVPGSSVPEANGAVTWRQMFDTSRKNDANALREAIKNGLH